MNLKEEKLTQELFKELMPLLEMHYDEITHYKDIKLNPDIERYVELCELGYIKAFTCRTDSGDLVGYAAYFLNFNMHYKDSYQANQDVVYIHPDHRGFNGLKFLRFCDEKLKEAGVQVTYHHIKDAHNWGKVLERMNYKLVDLIYSRRL